MKTINIFSIIAIFGFFSVITFSCKKDEEISPNDKNSIILKFENRVGDKAMVLNTGTYKNASGEDFSFTTFNYFISNISLKKDDGTVVKLANQYFLLRQVDAATMSPELKDIPAGNYNEITFTVGVDSTKSVSDVSQRTGVLDPTSYGDDGMYWSWNSGYIFMKIEGISSVVPTRANGKKAFQIHVGGFGGRTAVGANNIKTVTLSLSDVATVRANTSPNIHLFVDAMKVFDGVNKIELVETNLVHSPVAAKSIAENISKIFSVDHVHN